MRIARTPASARKAIRAWRASGDSIGFVPTMGALHKGHVSLLRRARSDCDRLVASVFVNPLQFGPREDFANYPRPVSRDRRIMRDIGTDLLYAPSAGSIFPAGFQTRVVVEKLQLPMEGRHRPGHFDGVSTIVAKLLGAVEADRLYLGQKDAQQAILLDRMVRDLDIGTKVIVCPTIRERDGLACSSRNAYLTSEERAWAPALYRALRGAAAELRSGELKRPATAESHVRRSLADGPGKLQYVKALHAKSLSRPRAGDPILLALAYQLKTARLIDNVVIRQWRSR